MSYTHELINAYREDTMTDHQPKPGTVGTGPSPFSGDRFYDPDEIEAATGVPRPPGWVESNMAAIHRDVAEVAASSAQPEGVLDSLLTAVENYTPTGVHARGICERAADLVNGPRNVDYGDARDNFTETAALWSPILGIEVTAEQVALCMAQVKIARLIHNSGHADSWLDGVGYLALGGGIARRREEDQ